MSDTSRSSKERMALVTRQAQEVVTDAELQALLERESPRAYIGFEPSGLVHIGWKLCANKINDLIEAGFEVIVLFADWHAYINDKLGGNLSHIKTCAAYMKDCFAALGVDRKKIKFVYANDFVREQAYWERVIKIAKSTTLSRVKRAMSIMGRKEEDAELDYSKTLYPVMQVADIFQLDVDMAYGGMDQRHAHMLARDVAEKLDWKKPVALHTPLLPDLQGSTRMNPTQKMSKSAPDSALFIHDSEDDIRRKIKKAYCPEKSVDDNPILDLCKYLIFRDCGTFLIARPEKFGGNVSFDSYDALAAAYAAGEIHPQDLKNATADSLIEILSPVRDYFKTHPDTLKKMQKLLEAQRKE